MKKNNIIIISALGIIVVFLLILYLLVIPSVLSNEKFVDNLCYAVNKRVPFTIKIDKPVFKTNINSDITIGAGKVSVFQSDSDIVILDNFKTVFSLRDILRKRIYIDNFNLDYVFVNTDKLLEIIPKQETSETKQNDWNIDLYDSILSLKKGLILYSPDSNTNITLRADNINIDNTRKIERPVHFDIGAKIDKNGKVIGFRIADKDSVVIKNKHLYINDCIFNLNKSVIHINAKGSREKGLDINLSAKRFRVEDVVDIIESNLIINNGKEIMSYLKNPSGDFDFSIDLKKNDILGVVTLNKAKALIVPLNNMPVTFNNGEVKIDAKNITLNNFNGYYGVNPANKASLNGIVKDYMKSCETDIVIKTKANNEFAKNYLSPIAGVPLEIIGKAGTLIEVKSINDKIDIVWASKLAKGDDILVDGASLSPTGYDRAVKADLHIKNNILDIENINYYISSELKKGVKVKPVLALKGRIDISKAVPDVKEFGFDIPRPLPSEFLNVLAGQKLFKGGKFFGELYMVKKDDIPVIKGHINANDIKIPSQRIYLKNGEITTNNEIVHINSNGFFKRSQFDFNGDIKNAVVFPIVIKNVDFELDKLNLEKLLASSTQAPVQVQNNNEDDEESVTFDFNNLIIEKCVFKLKEGFYKNIKFGNLNANLTLNESNMLELHSNKFDVAEGISTIKVLCDLNKHKYYLRLGVKEVNSDLMSTVLLNLPREISGKASGLIELNTDDTFKLNGKILFAIKDGQIQKIGLVEYLMKFASLFRNPIVMVSPSTISDIVNIPEGNFDKITGELYLKNNRVELLKIKSSAKQLSSYIVGCYDIETSDAILRIYTKFSNKNKGFGGFLRNISLSSLANRVPISSKNDVNYYAAELEHIPPIDADEKDCQIFLTKVDGDIEHNNFLSSLRKIK